MQFLTLFALAGAFASGLAAPAPEPALEKRLGPADEPKALARVTTLYSDVKQYTAVINSTAAGLGKTPTAAQQAAAGPVLKSAIASINSLVVATTSDIKGGKLAKRQAPAGPPAGGLPAQLALIIVEIGGALNQIIATLGLTATLSFLGPLVGSLSLLLASLIPVVNNLLALVAALVDGVLGGLSLALAGLVL
ncbi:MAG: hypothetical protein L6R37_005530 [Teloschistes peruensis]|nr:MAG: hypothetical protein L6R37_005530 [Teloschistes peruensis]